MACLSTLISLVPYTHMYYTLVYTTGGTAWRLALSGTRVLLQRLVSCAIQLQLDRRTRREYLRLHAGQHTPPPPMTQPVVLEADAPTVAPLSTLPHTSSVSASAAHAVSDGVVGGSSGGSSGGSRSGSASGSGGWDGAATFAVTTSGSVLAAWSYWWRRRLSRAGLMFGDPRLETRYMIASVV